MIPLERNQREEEEEESPRFDDVADSGDGDWLPVFCACGVRQGCFWRRDQINNHEGEEQQLPWRQRERRRRILVEEVKMLGEELYGGGHNCKREIFLRLVEEDEEEGTCFIHDCYSDIACLRGPKISLFVLFVLFLLRKTICFSFLK